MPSPSRAPARPEIGQTLLAPTRGTRGPLLTGTCIAKEGLVPAGSVPVVWLGYRGVRRMADEDALRVKRSLEQALQMRRWSSARLRRIRVVARLRRTRSRRPLVRVGHRSERGSILEAGEERRACVRR